MLFGMSVLALCTRSSQLMMTSDAVMMRAAVATKNASKNEETAMVLNAFYSKHALVTCSALRSYTKHSLSSFLLSPS